MTTPTSSVDPEPLKVTVSPTMMFMFIGTMAIGWTVSAVLWLTVIVTLSSSWLIE